VLIKQVSKEPKGLAQTNLSDMSAWRTFSSNDHSADLEARKTGGISQMDESLRVVNTNMDWLHKPDRRAYLRAGKPSESVGDY
jgi:hypothetical protein